MKVQSRWVASKLVLRLFQLTEEISQNKNILQYYQRYLPLIIESEHTAIKEHNLQKNNMLVLNNLNPLMVHEIGAVEKDTARYALVYGIGYSYNFENNFLNYDTEIFLH